MNEHTSSVPAAPSKPAPAKNVGQARARLHTNGDDVVVLAFDGTDYQLHLTVLKRLDQEEGKRVKGVIRGGARRIDRIGTGGKFVEPVYGSPRRVAGRIVAIDAEHNTVTVDAGMPFVLKPTAQNQRATDFSVGDFITTAVMPGTSFAPAV